MKNYRSRIQTLIQNMITQARPSAWVGSGVATLLALMPSAGRAAAFTAGNIVVYRGGSGTGNEVNTGNPVFLDEYTPDGTLAQSVAMPTTASGAQKPLITSGTATSEGLLTRSTDGQYLLVPGYGTTFPTTGLAGSSGAVVPRVIGRVDINGNIDTSTALSDWGSANNPRSAASTDGTIFWGAAGNGINYISALGNTTSTALTVANSREVAIFNGQLYVSASSGSPSVHGIASVGNGTPTATGQTFTLLPGFTDNVTLKSPYGFFFCHLNGAGSAVDTLYVCDDTGTAPGGINKFSLVGGSWVTNGSVGAAADSYRGLTATVSGSTVVLYATRKGGGGAGGGGELVKIIDSTGYNVSIGSPTITLLATAAANTAFRGVALAPVAACTSPTTFNVTGGNGCTSSGVTIGLDNSQSGVNYQLFNGASPIGSFLAGTDGSVINFGLQTAAGSYTVTATNTDGNCAATMNGAVTITTPVSPSVSIAQSPAGSVCASSVVIFTATPVNGGAPTYVWKTNGVVVAGVAGNMFTNTAPVDNETNECEMTSTATCASPATADATPIVLSVTASINPSVTITASPGSTNCAGTSVTFTATPVNGGTPTYQWNTNGVAAIGETGSTFTTAGLRDGDVVAVVMTSTDPCRSADTAPSNPITVAVRPLFTPDVSVSANPGSTVCSNTSVTFTATPVNGGAAPTFQWRTNGTAVIGATSSILTTSVLKNNDVVTVVMTPSPEICVSSPTATSSGITMTVNPNLTPSVTVIANPSGAICLGTAVSFTATPANGGASPTFQWKTNGAVVAGAASSTYTNGALVSGDTITCVMTPSSEICVSPATATSSPVTMTVNTFGLATSFLSENFGTTGTNLPAGWSTTSATIAWVVGASAVSSGYSGASGGNNASLTLGGDSNTYLITPTINCSNLTTGGVLTFGLRKSSASFTNNLIIDASTDNGATWTAFNATILNANMANGSWSLQTVDLGSVINNQTQVMVRWHFAASGNGSSSTSNVRLDDVKLTATPVTQAAITAGGPTTICQGASATLTASPGGSSYLWSTTETNQSITVSSPGTYTVTIFDANGCSSSASQVVNTIPLPTVSVNSTTNCAGSSAMLAATTSASNPAYSWSPGGAATASITVSPASTTTYTVTVTDGITGCTNSGSGTVTVNSPATVHAGPDQLIQAGGAATLAGLIGGGASSATWTTSGTGSFDTNTLLAAVYTPSAADIAAGAVTLTLITDDPSGPCPAAADTMVITINRAPTAANAIYDCGPGSSVNIQITGTGGLAADPDGDALTVTASAPTLGTNAMVLAAGTFIHYQNTNGAPGLDSFTYTVNDGRGGTATGTIAVNVVAPGGQLHNTLSAPEILGAGPAVRLTFLGIPADNYALDWTHNLKPIILWLPLVTNAAGANGLVVYTNTPSLITPDFYRARQVP